MKKLLLLTICVLLSNCASSPPHPDAMECHYLTNSLKRCENKHMVCIQSIMYDSISKRMVLGGVDCEKKEVEQLDGKLTRGIEE